MSAKGRVSIVASASRRGHGSLVSGLFVTDVERSLRTESVVGEALDASLLMSGRSGSPGRSGLGSGKGDSPDNVILD